MTAYRSMERGAWPGDAAIDEVPNAALDANGELRVVTTADYERLKERGVGAPSPGNRYAYVLFDSERLGSGDLLYISRGGGEWVETPWPESEGDVIPLSPGDAIRVVDAHPRLVMTGMI